MRTSCGPGAGRSRSSICRGPPGFGTTIARIFDIAASSLFAELSYHRNRGTARKSDEGLAVRSSIARPHPREHAVALDEAVIECAAGVERDDRRNEKTASEVPDENLVGHSLILAEQSRKAKQAEDVDGIAISVGAQPAKHRHNQQQKVQRILGGDRSAQFAWRERRIGGGNAEDQAPRESDDHDDEHQRADGLVQVIETLPERSLVGQPLHRQALGDHQDDDDRHDPMDPFGGRRIALGSRVSVRRRGHRDSPRSNGALAPAAPSPIIPRKASRGKRGGTRLTLPLPPRVKAAQRSALTMLVIAGTLNYVDRATLSVANPLIRQDLGLSIADMGWLLSAFLWAYAIAQLPGGALVDRIGPRRLLAAGLAIWSAAQVAGGLVGGFGQFIIARVFLGLGEAPMFSSCVRVVRDWFNVRQRGLAMGICNSTSSLGPCIAPPILTFLMLEFGWRWMFVLMGVLGIVIAIIWVARFRDAKETQLTPEESAFLTEGEEAAVTQPVTFAEWSGLFRFRTTWGLILGFFGIVYITWLFQGWLPGYLEIQRHMSIRTAGFVAAIPYACGVVGSIGAGWVTDRLMAGGFSPINSRQLPIIIGLVAMAAFTFVAAETPSNEVAVMAISAAVFFAG